jgi:cytochrome c oxidase subunit 2
VNDDRRHDVNQRGRRRIGRLTHVPVASAVVVALVLGAAACGDSGDGGDDAVPGATGGVDVANGEQLARSTGCPGCHGQDFGGGAGPTWIGLAGSQVTLADGSTLVADTSYLTRAIADPSADVVADYTLRMPTNRLSEAEIADIVAFIETLADG